MSKFYALLMFAFLVVSCQAFSEEEDTAYNKQKIRVEGNTVFNLLSYIEGGSSTDDKKTKRIQVSRGVVVKLLINITQNNSSTVYIDGIQFHIARDASQNALLIFSQLESCYVVRSSIPINGYSGDRIGFTGYTNEIPNNRIPLLGLINNCIPL